MSRNHAEIIFNSNDQKFLIKDSRSKFGTLILFEEEFALYEKRSLIIQSGRCMYELALHKKEIE